MSQTGNDSKSFILEVRVSWFKEERVSADSQWNISANILQVKTKNNIPVVKVGFVNLLQERRTHTSSKSVRKNLRGLSLFRKAKISTVFNIISKQV